MMLAVAAYIPLENRLSSPPILTRYNLFLFPVPQPMDDWKYWVRDQEGKEYLITICKSLKYNPPFDEGETILEIRFKNYGVCWEPTYYRMERDVRGELIIRSK